MSVYPLFYNNMQPKTPTIKEKYSKMLLPQLSTENPVISIKTTANYMPLSRSSSRLLNQSPKLDSKKIQAIKEIFKGQHDEKLNFESKVMEITQKLRKDSNLITILGNLKGIFQFIDSFQSSDKQIPFKFLENIVKCIEEISEEKKKHQLIQEKLLEEIAKEKLNSKKLNIQNKQSNISLQDSLNRLSVFEKVKAENFNNFETTNRKYLLEKEKLIEKIHILEEYISELKDVTKIEMILSQLDNYKDLYEKTCKEFSNYKKDKDAQIYKLELTIGSLKEKINSNENFMKNYYTQTNYYEEKIKEYEKSNKDLTQQLSENEEKLYMFNEDMSRFITYKDQYEINLEQLNNLRSKYQQLELSVMDGNLSLNSDGVVWVSLEDPIFMIARRTSKHPTMDNLAVQEKTIFSRADYASFGKKAKNRTTLELTLDVNQVDLKKFKINRPSFAGFLDLDETTLPFETPYKDWLQITIRGIYDSKFLEHQKCTIESGKSPSRLPEFVYSWLGNYTIDNTTRKVKELETWKKSKVDKIRLDFLLGLAQEKVKKNWEIQTFVDFMNEDMMIDELAFFLHCRNLLFKGSQFGEASGQFASIHLVSIKRIEEVIDIVMEEIDPSETDELKKLLRDKGKIKDGVHLLDSGFALRVFLEYYIREKKAKYLTVRTLFNLAPKIQKNSCLGFKSFKDILRNLNPDILDLTIAKLFRDFYSCNNEEMNPDNLFLICNENFVFFHSLRLKSDLKISDIVPISR